MSNFNISWLFVMRHCKKLERYFFLWYKTLLVFWRFDNRSYHFQAAYSLKQNKTKYIKSQRRKMKREKCDSSLWDWDQIGDFLFQSLFIYFPIEANTYITDQVSKVRPRLRANPLVFCYIGLKHLFFLAKSWNKMKSCFLNLNR